MRHRASTSTRWHFVFALCCHSNETSAPIANPPNSAQLGGTPYHSPSYIRVHAVVWASGCGQTDTQTSVNNIHSASSTTHVKCNDWTTHWAATAVAQNVQPFWHSLLVWQTNTQTELVSFTRCRHMIFIIHQMAPQSPPHGCVSKRHRQMWTEHIFMRQYFYRQHCAQRKTAGI